jgi:hypothetical protein
MGDRAAEEQVAHIWYTRPVLFVADIGRSIRFYTEGLGSERRGMKQTARVRSAKSTAAAAR